MASIFARQVSISAPGPKLCQKVCQTDRHKSHHQMFPVERASANELSSSHFERGTNKTTFENTIIEKGFDIMSEQQPSPILGLNFLQDVKAEPTAIAGAYDPEQEVWATLEQVQGGVSRELPRSLSNIRQGSSGQRLGAKPTERYTSDMDGNSDVSHD